MSIYGQVKESALGDIRRCRVVPTPASRERPGRRTIPKKAFAAKYDAEIRSWVRAQQDSEAEAERIAAAERVTAQ